MPASDLRWLFRNAAIDDRNVSLWVNRVALGALADVGYTPCFKIAKAATSAGGIVVFVQKGRFLHALDEVRARLRSS